MTELKMEHVLMVTIVIFVIYHFIGRCRCNSFKINLIEGFWSVDYGGHTCSGGTDLPDEAVEPDQTTKDAAATACLARLNENRCFDVNYQQPCRSTSDSFTCRKDCGLGYETAPVRRWVVIGDHGNWEGQGYGNTYL